MYIGSGEPKGGDEVADRNFGAKTTVHIGGGITNPYALCKLHML